MRDALKVGIDIGSTTIKSWVQTATGELVFRSYARHHAAIDEAFQRLLDEMAPHVGTRPLSLAMTGSAAMDVAAALGCAFVQEVICGAKAIEKRHPEANAIIELGGEDAKITYLAPHPEQRMNGSCAGGTGAFIDQMATLLQTDAQGLNTLAASHRSLYPIASRCGVFAKSDLQPLINDGASREDLAASVLQAIVNQTIAGLACGRPLQGVVVLLGGPLAFLDQLALAFERTLSGQVERFIRPEGAQYVVAEGASHLADGEPITLATLAERWRKRPPVMSHDATLPPLFVKDEERLDFRRRHGDKGLHTVATRGQGPYCLGIDAGSTTTKVVLIDSQGDIVFHDYRPNDGDPISVLRSMLLRLYDTFGDDVVIQTSCATGYGEALMQAAFDLDMGVVETMAHARGAARIDPDVSFVLDIGGQDMKCLHISNGVVDRIVVNEACSSGCGSFLQTFASALNMDITEFEDKALTAKAPVDLGTRCTVFMNSKVKQAQKEGASVADIAAGLAYSVVRNALYKVLKIKDKAELGAHVVVQGGTFMNDAVLRAFECVLDRPVARPPYAGLMGAYGAALIAQEKGGATMSRVLRRQALGVMTRHTSHTTCCGCENRCALTIIAIDGRQHISGNRCERGVSLALARPQGHTKPGNLYRAKYARTFRYTPRPVDDAPRGLIGVPRTLNMYENYPFWFTLLDALGFRVVLSEPSSSELFALGMASIPSESVCYPAKLAHGHIESLIRQGVTTIFYPDVVEEAKKTADPKKTFNCPIVTSYPELLGANMTSLAAPEITFLHPFCGLADKPYLATRLWPVFRPYGVTKAELKDAVAQAEAEDVRYRADIESMGQKQLVAMRRAGRRGVVLAGRPYHLDPAVHHGIPDIITQLGFDVFTEDCLLTPDVGAGALRVVDQWAYHSRLYAAARLVAKSEDLELVQLNSFGCGLDAITTDQVEEILKASGKLYTCLKIDEIQNLGAAKIRLRSLAFAIDDRKAQHVPTISAPYAPHTVTFDRTMTTTYTVLAPQMSPIHFRLLEAVFRHAGVRLVVLEKATRDDIEVGLRYVNNDACYPSIVVVGQLMRALLSGEYDPKRTALLLSQTGGACRATNYVAFLRKALHDAGYADVPVIALSATGIERHEGVPLTPALIHHAIQAVVAGDVLQRVLLATRPYEAKSGSAYALYKACSDRFYAYFERGDRPSDSLRRPPRRFSELLTQTVESFDRLPVIPGLIKPKVGIVGEILVKYHPDANNHLVDYLEAEGCEAVLPSLLDFFLYCAYTPRWSRQAIHTSRLSDGLSRLAVFALERYRRHANRCLARSKRFQPSGPIATIAARAQTILSLGNHAGEGWFLTGEMLELIADGVPNIVLVQPFACLPNHVTGKGMVRALRERYPEANIVPVDFDAGASEVNQQNRVKLMLSHIKRPSPCRVETGV